MPPDSRPNAPAKEKGNAATSIGEANRACALRQKGLIANAVRHHSHQRATVLFGTPHSA